MLKLKIKKVKSSKLMVKPNFIKYKLKSHLTRFIPTCLKILSSCSNYYSFIPSNLKGVRSCCNAKSMSFKLGKHQMEYWSDFIQREDKRLKNIRIIKEHFVVLYLKNSSCVIFMDGREIYIPIKKLKIKSKRK